MALYLTSVQARGAVLVNLEIAGTLFVTNFRVVFLVWLTPLACSCQPNYMFNTTCFAANVYTPLHFSANLSNL